MLQRVQAERHEGRGLGDADHAEDAALLVQLVVVERGRQGGQSDMARYIEGAPAGCHAPVMADQLQLCVRRSYWPAIHCGASTGSIAAIRASSPEKIATLWLSSIMRHAAGAAEDAVVDDERDHHQEHAAGDAEEEAEALVDRADRGFCTTPASSGVKSETMISAITKTTAKPARIAELAAGAEDVAQHRDLAHQRRDHRREGEAGQRRDDPADDRQRLAHEAAGVGEDGRDDDDAPARCRRPV